MATKPISRAMEASSPFGNLDLEENLRGKTIAGLGHRYAQVAQQAHWLLQRHCLIITAQPSLHQVLGSERDTEGLYPSLSSLET